MSLTIRVLLLAICFSVCANAQTRTLALYAGSARGLDLEAGLVMRAELRKLLLPAGIDLVWKSLNDRKPGEIFELLAVSSFEGSCAGNEVASTSGGASLADTSIVGNQILPFFRIDCNRVIGILGPRVQPAVLGRALARLAAHEIYHIVAQTTEHESSGIAKAVFSLQDLTAPQLELDTFSLARMRPHSIIQTSEAPSGAFGR
jgi:hypothetical protein